jgi:hypothetical protein
MTISGGSQLCGQVDAPGPQDGVRRPWWRRMFGG